jgi:hypothetical protein
MATVLQSPRLSADQTAPCSGAVLRAALEGCAPPLYIGAVRHIDFDSEPTPLNSIFYPALTKRMIYEMTNSLAPGRCHQICT